MRRSLQLAVYIIAWALLFSGTVLHAQSNFLDSIFDIGTGAQGGFVESMAIQPDGKILICGNFTSFNGFPKSYVARLNSNGSVDTNFTANVSYWTRYMSVQADGKIVIGGYFNYVEGQSRNLLARLNADGSLDPSFDVGTGCEGGMGVAVDGKTNAFVFAIAIQPDQKILVGGNFTNYNGVFRRGVVRLNTNGVLDETFNGTGVNNWLRSMRVQDNGQIILTGWFTEYNNRPYNRMVRVNADGSADTNFNAYFGDLTSIYTSAGLPDGKMVVGGHTVNSNSVFQQEVVRLNTDGSYDTNFNNGGSGANDKIESVAVQSDGKIVIGGYVSLYNGAAVQNLARLNSDGTLDNTFSASVDNWIWTVLLQADGKLLICGGFSNVNGVSRNGIARFSGSPSMLLFNPKRFSNRFEVSLVSQSGKNYTLQYVSSVSSTNWTSLSPVAGDGTTKTLSDLNPSATNRFYRVIQN
jgi:uncharacterized delta-60 repeat protein